MILGGTSAVSAAVASRLATYATSGSVVRLAGADRYATAARVSSATFAPGVPVVYVSTGTSFPDALAGGVAAGRQGGPVLLVAPTSLPGATRAELQRLRPARIVVLGGTSAVSDGVLGALRSYTTGGVARLSGADRYATAVAISRATTKSDAPRSVYLATGASFPDGLAGTPVAARAGGPLLIVPSSGLTSAVADELRRLNPSRIVILGGPSVVLVHRRRPGRRSLGLMSRPRRTSVGREGDRSGHGAIRWGPGRVRVDPNHATPSEHRIDS